MTLYDQIYKQAKALQACTDVEKVRLCHSIADLAKMYFNYIDFCFEKDFPGRKTLEQHRHELINYGIIQSAADMPSVDLCRYAGLNDAHIIVQSHGKQIVSVYAKDKSFVSVSASDRSIISVRLWGNAVVKANAFGDSRIIIRLYDKAEVITADKYNEAKIIIVK